MESFAIDLRYALRTLRQNAGFAFVVVLTLSLGVGATAAMFAVAYGVLLRPLPYPDPGRIVAVKAIDLDAPELPGGFSGPNFHALRQQSGGLAVVAALRPAAFNLTDDGGLPETVSGLRVSAEFFTVMGRAPILGQFPEAKDDRQRAERVAVLGHRLWQRRFGGAGDVLGRRLTFDDEVYAVIGVAAADYEPSYDLFVPLAVDHAAEDPGRHYLFARARLHDGVTAVRAEREMRALVRRHAEENPELMSPRDSVAIRPLRDEIVGDSRQAILLLHAAVALVLLIACVNVAHLLLARTAARRREMALRTALGAGRRRLLRLFFLENLLLTLAGGAGALLLASWTTGVLARAESTPLPRAGDVRVDAAVLVSTVVLSLAIAGVLCWLPLRDATRLGLAGALREGSGRGTTAGRGRLRPALVTVEVALAFVLLIGAGLVIDSLVNLLDVDPGFDGDGVLTARLSLPRATYGSDEEVAAFYDRLLERVAAMPGVEEVGAVRPLPLQGGYIAGRFGIEGREETQEAQFRFVMPGYFRALRIPVLRGRALLRTDRSEAPPVVVVNDSAARYFWPDEDPVGKRLAFDPEQTTWWTIVGVVGDVHDDGLGTAVAPAIHFSYLQRPVPAATLVVRLSTPPEAATAAVSHAVAEVDPRLPLRGVGTLADVVDRSLARPRFHARLFAAFAFLALALAAVGVYGLVSYSVSCQRQEIGVRRALGARGADVVALVLRQGMKPVLIGLLAGTALASGLVRFLPVLLYGVEPMDPPTFAAVGALLAAVAAAACWVPARRAAGVEPASVLRDE